MTTDPTDLPQPIRPVADCHCADFSRSQALRNAAAAAGRGLPAIEPGMPLPAGTGLSRRSFMLRSAGLALAVYGTGAMAPEAFEEYIAGAQAAGPSNAVLVSVFLSGGADGMSILAPTGHAEYAGLRPTLAIAPDAPGSREFSGDPSLRWAPSASSFAQMYEDDGNMAVFPSIGYASPNQSHFTSRHYWEVGEVNPFGRTGWLGRWLDRYGSPSNPLQGLSLNSSLSPSLATSTVPVAAVSSPSGYTFSAPGVSSPISTPMLNAFGSLGNIPGGDDATRRARSATASTSTLRQQMSQFTTVNVPAGVNYPNNAFATRLAALGEMLFAGLDIRAVSLQAPGGYDTHSNQGATLPNNVQVTGETLAAFQRHLVARGLQDRVITHCWSEFGRRPRENGSGTDHGAGGASFLIGAPIAKQMVGSFPGLASLDSQQNLRSTSDFRGLYCAILEQWLNADAAAIIPGADGFTRPTLLKNP